MCPEHQVGWLCICNPCKDQWRSCGAALTPQVMGEGFRDRSHGATMPGVSEDGRELCKSSSFCGDSDDSVSSSSSSSNVVDDATSSESSGALRLDSQGPLFELSSLMAQLPIKYFQGKSQSFTSLSDVRCIEDLAKEETPYRKRVKTWRRPCFTPGPRRKSLAKKASRGPCASSLARSSRSNLLRSGKPPT
ncbi:hypothetical protein B296_00035533 [Ensete ventricosum]|uniref:Uncharacterized protein n=1 Tax=Ensete ventricosum TaxID=4639 RepID=A0A427A5E1_ENSVE|nr:hypothetical protein B296_00035533 [Ensete ventricosum]